MASDLPAWTAFTGLLPLLVGGAAAAMRLFVEPIREFRSRAGLIEKRLLEVVAFGLSALLNHVRRIDDDSVLRGDGRNEPDLVGDHTESMFRLFRVVHRLEILRSSVRWCFNILLSTALLGVAGVLVAALVAASRLYVVYAVVGLTAIQFVCVVINYQCARKLEQYEDIA